MADLSTHKQVLDEAEHVQNMTKASLRRIQQQTNHTEDLGENTLEGLRDQHRQIDKIIRDGQGLDDQLNKTWKMQNRLDRFAGNWGGRRKREAKVEAAEIRAANERDRRRSQHGTKNGHSNKGYENVPRTMEGEGKPRAEKVVQRSSNARSGASTTSKSAKLDATSKMGLEKLAKNDSDIDSMLEHTAASLDRLAKLSVLIREETNAQTTKAENLCGAVESAVEKQGVANSRVKGLLSGRWLKRAERT